MQANDIKPSKTYAIQEGTVIVRFHVDQVDTTKHKHFHKMTYSSEAHGYIDANDWDAELPEDMDARKKLLERWVPVDKILGEFTQYTELKAKEEAEAKAQKEEADRRAADAKALVRLFYQLISMKEPDQEVEHGKPYKDQIRHFETSYSEVRIDSKGVPALLAVLTSKQENC